MEMKYLQELADIKTGKYDANHSTEDGEFLFYTCAFEQFKSPTYSFEGEAIVLPGNGANVGEVFYNKSGKFEAYQRTYVVYNIKEYVPYLYFYFKENWKKSLVNSQYGSATNYIRMDNLAKFKIPLPTLNEQKRIAKVLSEAEALIAQRKQSIALLDEFIKATFLEMFGDPVRNEKGWEIKILKKITNKIGSGATPRGGKEAYKKEGISLIRSLNIHDNKFFYENLAFIDEKQANKLKNVIVEKK